MRALSTVAVLGALCLAPLAAAPVTASATPPSDVTAETLFHAAFPTGMGSADLEGTEFTVRRIEIAPGGTTGWHYHDGPVYAYIESGTLTRVLHDCAREVTGAGGFVAEDVGADRPHEGINEGAGPLVLLAAYVEPPGDPFAEDAPDPGC